MKLAVKNLGAIKQGSVNLDKNLIILTGPNNTGKSYLSYLIYGITKFNELSEESDLEEGLRDVFSTSSFLKESIDLDNSINLEELANHHALEIGYLINNTIQDNFPQIFSSNLVKATVNLELSQFKLDYSDEDYEKLTIINEKTVHPTPKNGRMNKNPIGNDDPSFFENDSTPYLKVAHAAAWVLAFDLVHRPLFGRAYFFPAERTAVNLFARHLVTNKAILLDSLSTQLNSSRSAAKISNALKEYNQSAPQYPFAINDYINFVNSFEITSKESSFSPIADKIESSIIGGSISVSEFKKVVFTPSNSKQSLELHISSSLTKSLSYISLYLRYTAKIGDLVIIDEPELNLHPNLQVEITKILVEMVNAGLKVIISTHSDYLVKELNTLLILHDLYEDKKQRTFIKQHGYTPSELLDKKQVGAYYLHKGEITHIDVESNGIVVPSIDKTIATIDNFTEEVFFKLKSSKASKTSKHVKSDEPK